MASNDSYGGSINNNQWNGENYFLKQSQAFNGVAFLLSFFKVLNNIQSHLFSVDKDHR